jgi:hypothetical protein
MGKMSIAPSDSIADLRAISLASGMDERQIVRPARAQEAPLKRACDCKGKA